MTTILQTPCVSENFLYLADRILNYTVLMINGAPHRICEIEFYLNSPTHTDGYVHGHTDQTKKGTWYFHRFNNGTYKAGNYKGVDIVLGSPNEHAAVLIRAIYDINNQKFIEGPCLTVNHILSLSNVDSVLALTNNESLNILNNSRGLALIEGPPTRVDPIFYGPRIGLSNKYPDYRDRKYRYTLGQMNKNGNAVSMSKKERSTLVQVK